MLTVLEVVYVFAVQVLPTVFENGKSKSKISTSTYG